MILLLGLLGLGILVRTAAITRHDLHVDQTVERWRSPAVTDLFLGLTNAASEVVGIGALLIGVAVLLIRRRRWDAVRLVVMAGAAWALAIGVKVVIARPRPPAALWALRPDASGGFPSGHDTTACVFVLVVLVASAGSDRRLRVGLAAIAGAFAVLVGASRIYLGDHYPTDVLGSWLAVASAALIVSAVLDTSWVRRLGRAVLRDPHIPVTEAVVE